MVKNKIFQLRLSEELLAKVKDRNPNVSRYLRYLIQKDIKDDRDEPKEFIPEIKATTPFVYFATLLEVIDGDTLDVEVDLGFYTKTQMRVRLLGLNAPEIDEPKGVLAKEFLERELTGCQLVIETKKRGKYGRYLAYIYYHKKHTEFLDIVRRGKIINEEILREGLAVEY